MEIVKMNSADVEVEGRGPSAEELAQQKAILHEQIEMVYGKMIANEESVLTIVHTRKGLEEKYAEAKRLGDLLTWLQAINRNRFILPEQAAASEAERNKKIIH